MINSHHCTQVWGIRDTVDGVFEGEGYQQIVKTKQKSWKCTSGTIEHMAAELSNVREALKAVVSTTGDYGGATSVPVRYTHPGESTDRRLMDAVVADG